MHSFNELQQRVVAQHAPKCWVGVWKASQTPLTVSQCAHVFMFSSSLLFCTHMLHTVADHTMFFTRYGSKIRKSTDICHAPPCVHVRRHTDRGDTPSVKLLPQIPTSYCDSGIGLLIVLSHHFHNSIWHKTTTERINNIKQVLLVKKPRYQCCVCKLDSGIQGIQFDHLSTRAL